MRKLFIVLLFYPAFLLAQPNTVSVGTTANDGTGDPLRTAMQKLNANDVAIFDTAEAHLDRIEALEDAPNTKNVDYTTCLNAATTNITIGSTTTDISFLMHYTATRDMTVVLTQSGNIEVQYDGETGNVYYTSDYLGPDLYFSIEADYDGTNIRLNIIVTPSYGSGTNSVMFDYKITSKFSL